MSVITVGGERFAVGLEWSSALLSGNAAGTAAANSGLSWVVDVEGQTGLAEDVDNPEGVRPLAGALRGLAGSGGGNQSWVAFVEEDEGSGQGMRVAMVRCVQGLLLPDGDRLFASSREALEGLESLRAENVTMVVTPGLSMAIPEATVVEGADIAGGGEGVAGLAAAPRPGVSRKTVVQGGMLAVAGGLAAAGFVFSGDVLDQVWDLFFAEEVVQVVKDDEPPPTVETVVSTMFLEECRREFERRQVRMAGFERVKVGCHARFIPGEDWMPIELADRGVFEVRWELRKPLRAEVYRPLAQDLLSLWYRAGVDDAGQAVAVSPLPARVIEKAEPGAGVPPPVFRSRLDRAFSLRGVEVEFAGWGANIEVALKTGRPLRDAVALMRSVDGLEVLSAEWTPENGWVFRGRRTKTAVLLESRFIELAERLPEKGREDEAQAMEVRG